LKEFTFVIIDDNQDNAMKTKAVAERFQNLHFLAVAHNYDDGLDVVLETQPDIVFLEINPADASSNLSLEFINELHRYLKVVPKIFVTTSTESLCYKAFKYGVFDYFVNPLQVKDLRKTLFRLDKEYSDSLSTNPSIFSAKEDAKSVEVANEIVTITHNEQADSGEAIAEVAKPVKLLRSENDKVAPLIICVKSYGDYRYIDAKDIAYLQADNNSTDIHLNGGEMITAFKTLKHFEGILKYPFVRIHNSYIVNVDFISRIHTGNTVCHIKNSTTKLPFSKSYKENVDAIIATIASGNYLEI
jgi:DNA-binding LytR/AlgR family response regulator